MHHDTCIKYINEGKLYLDFFKITDFIIPDAVKLPISTKDLVKLIIEKRTLYLKNHLINKLSIPITVTNVGTK